MANKYRLPKSEAFGELVNSSVLLVCFACALLTVSTETVSADFRPIYKAFILVLDLAAPFG